MEFEDLLWKLLDDWRQTKAVEDYGILVAKRNGPALIMPKGIIDRVVDCAHYEKIKNLQDLRRETGWNCPDEIGLTVVALVAAHGSPPAPIPKATTTTTLPSNPMPVRGVLTSNTLVVNARAPASRSAPVGDRHLTEQGVSASCYRFRSIYGVFQTINYNTSLNIGNIYVGYFCYSRQPVLCINTSATQ